MCTGAEILPYVLGAAGATVATQVFAPKPQMPSIQTPEKAQATKAPDRGAIATANASATLPGGTLAGNSGTFLTGPSGIDPSTLNLGKNTLLGQ